METLDSKQFNKNPNLTKLVEPENDLKNMLVEYVGEELNPEDQKVTVVMIIEVMARQFPEFVLDASSASLFWTNSLPASP